MTQRQPSQRLRYLGLHASYELRPTATRPRVHLPQGKCPGPLKQQPSKRLYSWSSVPSVLCARKDCPPCTCLCAFTKSIKQCALRPRAEVNGLTKMLRNVPRKSPKAQLPRTGGKNAMKHEPWSSRPSTFYTSSTF